MAKTPGTGIAIGTHFSPRFKRPIDDRYTFDTIAEMKSFSEAALYNGIETFNNQDKKTYKYLSTNSVDPTTGKWRLVGSESYSKEESDKKFISVDQKNVADGVAGLDESGKIIKSQLSLNKKDVGLDNVDNTADLDKPISKDTQDALDLKANITDVETDLLTKANKNEVYDKTETDTLLNTKVDKIDGKNLSTNDLTDELKAEYDDAVLLKHSHDNKALLDTLTDDLIQKWDNKQDLIQYDELPLASADLNGKIYQYIGIETEHRKVGSFYKCIEKTTDVYDWVELQPEIESIQKETLPAASIDFVDKIYQYIGKTTETYMNGYFYKCIEDPENLGTYIWKQKTVQPSSAVGSATYTDTEGATVSLGGWEIGDKADEMDFQTAMYKLLHPYILPTLQFSISPSNTVYKKGTSVNSIILEATTEKKTSDVKKVTFFKDNASIYTQETDTAGGTYSYTYNTAFELDTIFKATVIDTQNKSVTAIQEISFVNPYYIGSSTISTISDFTGLTEKIVVKDTKKEVVYEAIDNEYLVFAYNKSYGNLTSIKDENSFENIGSWNKDELTIDGQDYFVYITQLPITIENRFKYTFII